MPLSPPSGTLSLARSYLAEMLAECAAFQAFVGASGSGAAAQAAARIHHTCLPPPAGEKYTAAELSAYRPFALVSTAPTEGLRRVLDAADSFGSSGRIEIKLEQDVDTEIAADPAEIEQRFENAVGAIIDELCARAAPGHAGELAFNAISLTAGPWRPMVEAYEEQGDYIACELMVEWEA